MRFAHLAVSVALAQAVPSAVPGNGLFNSCVGLFIDFGGEVPVICVEAWATHEIRQSFGFWLQISNSCSDYRFPGPLRQMKLRKFPESLFGDFGCFCGFRAFRIAMAPTQIFLSIRRTPRIFDLIPPIVGSCLILRQPPPTTDDTRATTSALVVSPASGLQRVGCFAVLTCVVCRSNCKGASNSNRNFHCCIWSFFLIW